LGGTASPNTPVNFFNGTIDQTRIYNRVLSPQEIQQLYTETSSSSIPTGGLVGEWKFDGNTMDTSGIGSSTGGSPITGYKMERSTDNGSTWGTLVSNTGSTSTTYSDMGLSSNTTYAYRVSAINSVGTSNPSNTASATTGAPTNATSYTINVADDSYTHFTPPYDMQNFNGQGLVVKDDFSNYGGKDNRKTWLKFDLPVAPSKITHAVLRMYLTSVEASGSRVDVYRHDNSNWSEGTITYDNEPAHFAALSAGPFAGQSLNMSNQYYEWDVTNAITSSPNGNTVTLVLVGNSINNGAGFADKESGKSPQLLLDTITNGITVKNIQSTSGAVSSSNQITLANFNSGTGNNPLLVVGVGTNNNDVVSVTFGGTPLSQVVKSFYNNDAEFWYLKNPTGTGDIVVTTSGPTSAVVGAYSLSGVDQTNPVPTSMTNHNTASSSPAISITTQYQNSLVLDLPSIYGGVTLGSPTCTQGWDVNVPDIITGASSSTMVSTPSSVSCSWTASQGGDLWDDVAVEIKAK
jgi:hypothetical protein